VVHEGLLHLSLAAEISSAEEVEEVGVLEELAARSEDSGGMVRAKLFCALPWRRWSRF
jgi:hypothetical protein